MPTLADLKYYADTQVDTPYLARLVAEEPSLEGISAFAGGSTLGIATPRQRKEAQAIRKDAQPVINAVADPVYAFTPGTDQRRQDARRRILEKVAAVTTDPMAATFAGVGAKMADKAALARSLEMKAAGVPDREIWAQTGWTHGFPDGKPRFEIDDSAAEFRGYAGEVNPEVKAAMEAAGLNTSGMGGQPASSGAFPSTVRQMMKHGELQANYPEVSKLPVNWQFGPEQGGGHFTGESITVRYPDTNQGKSTLLHEAQHAIQEKEGFARGGNLEMFTDQAAAETARDALTYARELQRLRKQYPNADIIALENKLTEEYQKLGMLDWLPSREARELGRQPYVLFADKYPGNKGYQELTDLVKTYKLDQRATPLSARDAYTSLAGEVEARLTQRRMSLNAQQRRQRYPIEDMDVKPKDQIVRFK